jgi:4-aminobutyrate aminotransferase-like enzyme
LIARTVAHTPESKRLTQRYRAVLADPRVAAGFRSEWKEMVYPVTCVRAKGSRLWDVDGNEYIDLLNGFGQTAFGHAPDFVTEAVNAQLERGFAIGPQTDLAGEVAELFCELTGNERMTFCNTGSEAVMAALRVARTVTGRERVVLFEGSYHGQFDEVLVKSAGNSRRSLPVALGIPAEAVANVTVLPYGTPESLAWIREHAAELAAVVVEPVQSRHPALRPVEFLSELRAITEGSGCKQSSVFAPTSRPTERSSAVAFRSVFSPGKRASWTRSTVERGSSATIRCRKLLQHFSRARSFVTRWSWPACWPFCGTSKRRDRSCKSGSPNVPPRLSL